MVDSEGDRMTADEYRRLSDAGILDEKVELIDGRMMFGRWELAWSPAQRAAAAELGIVLPNNEPAPE